VARGSALLLAVQGLHHSHLCSHSHKQYILFVTESPPVRQGMGITCVPRLGSSIPHTCCPVLVAVLPPRPPDFIVPASREAIVEDSAWNAELRDKIPGVLLRALDQLLALPLPAAAQPAPSAQGGAVIAPAPQQDPYLSRFNFWLQCLPLRGVAKVGGQTPHVWPAAMAPACLVAGAHLLFLSGMW
jgi:hypothetical protein